MKAFFYAGALLALLTVPVFASGKTKHQHIQFASPITVGTANFVPGECTVSWEETGDTVQVTLAQNEKKNTVTVPASLVKGDHPYVSLTTKVVDGVNVLREIQFDHYSLVFGAPEVASNTEPTAEP